MDNLDLHGVGHEAAEETIRSFLNYIELPCTITTGNSPKMKKILSKVIREYGWEMREPIYYNKGSFVIESKQEE